MSTSLPVGMRVGWFLGCITHVEGQTVGELSLMICNKPYRSINGENTHPQQYFRRWQEEQIATVVLGLKTTTVRIGEVRQKRCLRPAEKKMTPHRGKKLIC